MITEISQRGKDSWARWRWCTYPTRVDLGREHPVGVLEPESDRSSEELGSARHEADRDLPQQAGTRAKQLSDRRHLIRMGGHCRVGLAQRLSDQDEERLGQVAHDQLEGEVGVVGREVDARVADDARHGRQALDRRSGESEEGRG